MVGMPEYWHIGKIRIGFEDQVFQSQSKNSRLRPFISLRDDYLFHKRNGKYTVNRFWIHETNQWWCL